MTTLLAVALLLCVQDTEKAATSTVTGAALPDGAERRVDKGSLAEAPEFLKLVYSDARFAAVEYLQWAGDHTGDKGAALRRKAAQALEKAGLEYKEALCDQPIKGLEGHVVHFCGVTGARKRVLGVWISSGQAAFLIWGEDAGEATFNNVVYTVPPGWNVAASAEAVTLTPGDLLAEEAVSVSILAGREFSGDFAASTNALFAETCKALSVDDAVHESGKGAARTSFKGWDYFRVYGAVRKGDQRFHVDAWFIRVGGRLEQVVALTNTVNRPYDQTPLDSPKYRDTFTRFLFGLKFKNHKEPALPEARLTRDGIGGLWMGTGLGFDGELEYKGYMAAFYSNGMVFFSAKLQTFSFEGMDPYVAREVTPAWWGTYTFANGRGAIKMPSGEIPIELDGDKLAITRMKTTHKYARLDAVDGMRWDGTFALKAEAGAKAPTITFSKDGTFSDDGAIRILEHSLYALYSTGDKPGRGSYEVKNHTVIFRYADGRAFTAAYLGLGAKNGDAGPATLTLGFNHDTLTRK